MSVPTNLDFEPKQAVAESQHFSFDLAEAISQLDPQKIPQHIAIIMDGNRRWAKSRQLPPIMGHWEGAEVLTDIVQAASEIGVKSLTVYAFSTENWHRPDEEIEELMNLFHLYLLRKKELMVRDGIRLNAIGDLEKLPQRVQDAFEETRRATEKCNKINLILAMNYGGRDEIRRAVEKIVRMEERQEITEELIASHLDTSPWGDPDLLIRTSGELRVSNFLLWQICYAEIYITDVMWPEFTSKELMEAIVTYQSRKRRLGT